MHPRHLSLNPKALLAVGSKKVDGGVLGLVLAVLLSQFSNYLIESDSLYPHLLSR